MAAAKKCIEVKQWMLEELFKSCRNQKMDVGGIMCEIAELALGCLRYIKDSTADEERLIIEQERFAAYIAGCSKFVEGGLDEIDRFLINRHNCRRTRLFFRTSTLIEKADRVLFRAFGDQSNATLLDKCAGMLNVFKNSVIANRTTRSWLMFFLESAMFFFWSAVLSPLQPTPQTVAVSTPGPAQHTQGELEAARALVELCGVVHVF